ncbi:hypothetical protein Sjap_023490 [Stephania japonica]|uniref:Uncharacterized protein n=1 Tax=Stephania japonica TaxID=461633 RepID=A0AAP0HJ16_9MAGN
MGEFEDFDEDPNSDGAENVALALLPILIHHHLMLHKLHLREIQRRRKWWCLELGGLAQVS